MNKKITIGVAFCAMLLMSGCNTTQPTPTASGGQSKSAVLSGIETELMTGKFTLFQIGGTTINAKGESTITFVPNPPTLASQNNPF